MPRRRFLPFALLALAALVVAGAAAAGRGGAPSDKDASATFTATTVSHVRTSTCSVSGGDTLQSTSATYTGTATSSDARLSGTLTLKARSVVDTTTGAGHVAGVFRIVGANGARANGVFKAAVSGGQAAGLATGVVKRPNGRLVASLDSTFDQAGGFTAGSLGTGPSTGAGTIVTGGWCPKPHHHSHRK